MTDRKKYPNLFRYANQVYYPGMPPLNINMELVRLEQEAQALEEQIEKDKTDREQKQKDEVAKAEIQQRLAELKSDKAKLKPRSTKSRENKEKERVQASLIRWACETREPRLTSQGKACKTVGMNEKTYRRYRDDKLCLDDTAIEEMGSTFDELWNTILDGGAIEEILELN